MRKTVLFVLVETVMAVAGLFLGWEWAKPLPQPPRNELAVWLPSGPSDPSLMATWVSEQTTSRKGNILRPDKFQLKYLEATYFLVSEFGAVSPNTAGTGPYLLYFGKDAQGRVWASQEKVSGWSPMWEFPPRPYRPENYEPDGKRGVLVVTTRYDQVDSIAVVFLGFAIGILALPAVYLFLIIVGSLIFAITGIRFRSPIVREG